MSAVSPGLAVQLDPGTSRALVRYVEGARLERGWSGERLASMTADAGCPLTAEVWRGWVSKMRYGTPIRVELCKALVLLSVLGHETGGVQASAESLGEAVGLLMKQAGAS